VIELADIVRAYGKSYLAKFGSRMLTSHKRALKDILICRTELCGGHVYQCPDHDQRVYKYHSCLNRHCPKCQNDQSQNWLIRERKRLIKIPYFFLTFTLPKQLRPIARSNQRLFYKLLLTISYNALKKLALDPRFVGGLIGALSVLHTWKRNLDFHPHVHLLVPAGGVSADKTTWLPAQKKFFVPVKALSKIFRGMMRDALKKADPDLFADIPKKVWRSDWVVHCKAVGSGEAVLKYFAPYIYRIGISNKRIIKLEQGQVAFCYKDSHSKQWKHITVHVFEFLRRYLQHVLPKGFKKVRHYGLLSSKHKLLLTAIQYALGTVEPLPEEEEKKQSRPCCPICCKEMDLIMMIEPDKRAEITLEQLIPP